MSSTASTTSSSPSSGPDSGGAGAAQQHGSGDATVTEQQVPSRFTERAAARATAAPASASAPAEGTQPPGAAPVQAAAPAHPPTAAEPTTRVRRSPDLRAGARRAATLTGKGVDRLRTLLGAIVWIFCLLAAAALLVGAALVVLEANTHNALVAGVLKAADWADLGVFSRTAGIKQFTGENAVIKNAFVNWGLGAVVWLVVGRVARRILTP